MSNTNQEKTTENWDEIKVILKEYEALRAEILQLMENSSHALSYGVTGLAALWSAAAIVLGGTNNPSPTSMKLQMISIIVALVVPCVVAYSLRLWLLDTKSILRIGRYIMWLEHKIQRLNSKHILEWQTILNSDDYLPDILPKEYQEWKQRYFWQKDNKWFSFFGSHLFTVVWLYLITFTIAIYNLFFTQNHLRDSLKVVFCVILTVNTLFLLFPFLDVLSIWRTNKKKKTINKRKEITIPIKLIRKWLRERTGKS